MAIDFCICCGRRVNGNYRFCRDCENGRSRIYDDCVASGMSEKSAEAYVESMFPCRFTVKNIGRKFRRHGFVFNGRCRVKHF
jgi:hypothetical protein